MASNLKNIKSPCIPHGEGRVKFLEKRMKNVSINTGGKQQCCKLYWEISWMFLLHWWPYLLCRVRVTFVDSRYAYIKLWFWCYFGFVCSLKWSSCNVTNILKKIRIIVITRILHLIYRTTSRQANYVIHIYFINEILNPMTNHIVTIVTLSTWQYVPENKSQNKSEKRWKIVNCRVIPRESLYTFTFSPALWY